MAVDELERRGLVHVPYVVVLLLCFFIPVMVFVIGSKQFWLAVTPRQVRQARARVRSSDYWADLKQGWIRMACWFAGAVVATLVFAIAFYGRWPI
jgi:hypothetical protein